MKTGEGTRRLGLIVGLTLTLCGWAGRFPSTMAEDGTIPPGQSDIDRNGTVGPEDLLVLQHDWHTTSFTVADLFPLAAGNYWKYNTQYSEYGTEPRSETGTLTVSVITTQNTTAIPGYTSSVLRVSELGKPDEYVYLAVKNGALLILGEGSMYPGPVTVYDPPEIWLQQPVALGRMWITKTVMNTRTIPAVVTAGFDALDATVVTQNATYYNCVRVIQSAVGSSAGSNHQATEHEWFRPGIGPVKMESHRSWTVSPTGYTEGYDWVQTLYQYNIQ